MVTWQNFTAIGRRNSEISWQKIFKTSAKKHIVLSLPRTTVPCGLTIICRAVELFQVSTGASSALNAAGRNAVITSLIVCCGFFACWSFNMICFFVNTAFQVTLDFSGWFYHLTVVLVLMSSCINPFIYAAKYHEFQVPRVSKRRQTPAKQTAGSTNFRAAGGF